MAHLVRLKYATTQQFGLGGIPGGVSYTYIRAKVKNIGYEKNAQVHYKSLRFPKFGQTYLSLGWAITATMICLDAIQDFPPMIWLSSPPRCPHTANG